MYMKYGTSQGFYISIISTFKSLDIFGQYNIVNQKELKTTEYQEMWEKM